MKNKIERLKKEVMHYSKLLGVSHLVGEVFLKKELEGTLTAKVHLSIFMDSCDVYFTSFDSVEIIHELLHLSFKNTFNFMNETDNEQLKAVFEMIHEQEINRLAIALAKTLPECKEGK